MKAVSMKLVLGAIAAVAILLVSVGLYFFVPSEGELAFNGGRMSEAGDEEQSTAIVGEESTDRRVITIWHTFTEGSQEKQEFERAIGQFRADNPDYKISVEAQDYETAIGKYLTAASGKRAPDIMRFPNDRLGEVAALGYLHELDGHMTPTLARTYNTSCLDAMKFDGKLYALPASFDSLALVYNKRIFDSDYGGNYPDATWDEGDLLAAANALTSGDTYGLVFPLNDAYWWFPWQAGYGGYLMDAENVPGVNSPGSSTAASFTMSTEYVEGVNYPGGADVNKMVSLFEREEAAMIMTGPWQTPSFAKAEVDYGIAPLPIISSTGRRAAPLIGYKGYAVTKGQFSVNGPNYDPCFELTKWLTGYEVTRSFAANTSTIPANQDALDDPVVTGDADKQGFLAQLAFGQPVPTAFEMGMMWVPTSDHLERIYNTGSQPSAALIDTELQAAQDEIVADIAAVKD